MRVLVCGGRNYTNGRYMNAILDRIHRDQGISCVIQGGADGADRLGAEWAWDRKIPVSTFQPKWDDIHRVGAVVRTRSNGEKYDAAAGPIRNSRMLAEGRPDLVIAFPGGTGTADMVKQARNAGVQVMEIADVR